MCNVYHVIRSSDFPGKRRKTCHDLSPSQSVCQHPNIKKDLQCDTKKSIIRKKTSRWLHIIPSNLFQEKLIIITVMYAFYAALHYEWRDRATHRMMKEITSTHMDSVLEAKEYILWQVRQFEDLLPIEDTLNFEKVITALQGKYITHGVNFLQFQVQAHVFSKKTYSYIKSIPTEYAENVRQLYFLGEEDESGNIFNLEVIVNILTFFNLTRFLCFFCKY